MRATAWMTAASAVLVLASLAIVGIDRALDVLGGVLGPLAMAVGTWVMAERTYRRCPARLMPRMLMAFAGKMVFFGAYVWVMVRLLSPRAVPFVVSFTGSFILLHFMEAVFLRRLFAHGLRAGGRVTSELIP